MTLLMRDQEKYAAGFAAGENLFASLVQILVKDQRISDVEKASRDKAFRKKLYAEFQLL